MSDEIFSYLGTIAFSFIFYKQFINIFWLQILKIIFN